MTWQAVAGSRSTDHLAAAPSATTSRLGILPLVEALHAKGLAIGTILAFTMSVVALSVPELVWLRRVLKPRLLGASAGVLAVGVLAVGFRFNVIP